MAKKIICDGCGKQGEQNQYGWAPDGWFRLELRSERYEGSVHEIAKCVTGDYCSAPCAREAVNRAGSLLAEVPAGEGTGADLAAAVGLQ